MSDKHEHEFDLDEDLFDFGGVGPEPEATASEEDLDEIFASFREEARGEELAAAPRASADEPVPAPPAPAKRPESPARAESHAPAPSPAPAARPAKSGTPPLPTASTASSARAGEPEPVRSLTPIPPARVSKGLVAIALSVTVLNAALAVVMVRGNSDGHDVRATGDERSQPHVESPAPQAAAQVDALPDPESVPESHGHPTLDQAREELARGDHAAARQRVYGLLAIVDRLEDPRKSEIEAECQYLIAQSLHLEALARMGSHE